MIGYLSISMEAGTERSLKYDPQPVQEQPRCLNWMITARTILF